MLGLTTIAFLSIKSLGINADVSSMWCACIKISEETVHLGQLVIQACSLRVLGLEKYYCLSIAPVWPNDAALFPSRTPARAKNNRTTQPCLRPALPRAPKIIGGRFRSSRSDLNSPRDWLLFVGESGWSPCPCPCPCQCPWWFIHAQTIHLGVFA